MGQRGIKKQRMPLTKERQRKVKPIIEFRTDDGYTLKKYRRGPVITLEDLASGLTVSTYITNPRRRSASEQAWAGAMHSRSPHSPWVIADEMLRNKASADERISDTARRTGHASVGDLARVQHDVDDAPIHLMTSWFLEGWGNGGQEKSTRFIKKFYESFLHSIKNYLPTTLPKRELAKIEKEYQALGTFALSLHHKHYEEVKSAFEEYYKPREDQRGALVSRSLDCARFFILWGVCSGGTFENSVRDDARIIGNMKAAPVTFYRSAASQVERLFTLTQKEEKRLGVKSTAPGLLRHTEADPTTNENIGFLKEYLQKETDLLRSIPVRTKFRGEVEQKVDLIPKKYNSVERMVAQYVLSLWPGMDGKRVLHWLHEQNDETKEKIGAIIFTNHDRKHQMPYLGRTTDQGVILQGFVGEDRDLLRQRAWGRFMPIPSEFGLPWTKQTVDQIIAMGYGLPVHLNIPVQEKIKKGFINDLDECYRRLNKFVDSMYKEYGNTISYEFVINLLPLAHHVDLWMHGYPNQLPYVRDLRERGGGHNNYRFSIREFADLFADSNPFLRSVASRDRVNLLDRQDFFDRS